MASVQKFTEAAVCNELRHNSREIRNNSNKDIDPVLSAMNYSLLPPDGLTAYQRYKQRKSALYCYKRSDVKVMAGWVVTCPKEITDQMQQREFFQTVYDFLTDRYGKENTIQAIVHYDEGKREALLDRWGNPLLDADGKQRMQTVFGQPHLHYCFIPVVPDANPRHEQSEKICANAVLTRKELQSFHGDLQRALDEKKIECAVQNGVTKANGGNRTVAEMKESYALKRENERLRTEIEQLRQHERGRW